MFDAVRFKHGEGVNIFRTCRSRRRSSSGSGMCGSSRSSSGRSSSRRRSRSITSGNIIDSKQKQYRAFSFKKL